MWFSSCSSRPRPRLWLLRRNLAPAGEESFPVCACCHSVAEAPLPGGADAGGCVSSGAALLSGGVVKRAVPLLQNETQNMNTTEDLITTGCPAIAQQPINKVIKLIKFPAQPQEWKIVSLRECPTPENMQQCEPPDQAAAYWKSHIASHPYFNSECECHRRRSALTREARVVGFISSNSAAPPGPKTLPPLFLSAAVMLSRSWRFQSSRVRTDAVSSGGSFV